MEQSVGLLEGGITVLKNMLNQQMAGIAAQKMDLVDQLKNVECTKHKLMMGRHHRGRQERVSWPAGQCEDPIRGVWPRSGADQGGGS
jgi:hypothetical protein